MSSRFVATRRFGSAMVALLGPLKSFVRRREGPV
jgi:hypothetical protein